MGAAAAALQQAAERIESLNEALQQAATSHVMAQQTIRALQGLWSEHKRLWQALDQTKTRLDHIEETLQTKIGTAVTANDSGGPPQPEGESEDGPLMKRFRAITWRGHEK